MSTLPWHTLKHSGSSRKIAWYRLLVAIILVIISYLPRQNLWSMPPDELRALHGIAILALLWSLGVLIANKVISASHPQGLRLGIGLMDAILVLAFFYVSNGLAGPLAILPLLLVIANAYQLRGALALAQLWILIPLTILISLLRTGEVITVPTLIYALALVAVAFLADNLVRNRERSARRDAEQAREIFDLNALNREIIQQVDTGLMVLDRQHRILFSNPLARQMIHLAEEPALPVALDLFRPDFAELLNHGGDQDEWEVQVSGDADLRARSLLVRTSSLPGTPFRLLSLRDGTALRERQREQQMAALGRLAANIAHEIRNPLSAIRHAAQLLAEQALESRALRLLNIIERESRRLDHIVDAVLQMARPRPAHPQPISLASWLHTTLQQLVADPAIASVAIQYEIPESLPLVACDPEHLQQILANLLRNTAQHGHLPEQHGQVSITARTVSGGGVELRLRDWGPGIAKENLERIFEPFFTTASLGTGLGLAMVRELLLANGSRIELRNHPDGGAEFSFVLPQWNLGMLP